MAGGARHREVAVADDRLEEVTVPQLRGGDHAMTRTRRSATGHSSPSDTFLPLKGGRKSDQVFEQLAKFIQAGRFAPGSKLPTERELTGVFRTSRQTVREAIYRAELVGLIEVRHGSGSFVIAREPQVPADKPLMDLIRTQAHRIGEFFELRRALEGWCADHAAKARTEADLAAMKARLDTMRKLDVSDPRWEENDIGFHHALAAATGNPAAVRMMDVLRESFTAFYRLKRYIPNREEQKVIWRHHADIYDAIHDRASDRARAALIAHMDFVEGKLAESVDAFTAEKS
jgi:GntR family transcriptional repressor for pyruvate dehydrogenase complex